MMLSLNDILRVGRLLDQTGEPRPGFLHDETDNLEGQGTSFELGAIPSRAAVPGCNSKAAEKSVHVTLDYEEDPNTGDFRIVQR
jgi:hypothetical protein